MKEILVGYDIREMWLDIEYFWDAERRKTFLLQHEVEKPISVDTTVWPSAFDLDIDEPIDYMTDLPRSKKYMTQQWDNIVINHKSLSVPSKSGYRGATWDKLSVLKQNVVEAWSTQWKPARIVAITKFVDSDDDNNAEDYSTYFVVPSELHSSWKLLGYDVADDFFTGFISNAGYRDDEVEPLKQKWSEHFNQWHLFNNLDLARKYVDVAYIRDFNHGPFAVYGIYGIEQIELGEHPTD